MGLYGNLAQIFVQLQLRSPSESIHRQPVWIIWVGLIRIRFGSWKLRHLNRAFSLSDNPLIACEWCLDFPFRWAYLNVGAHHAKWSHRAFWANSRLPRKKAFKTCQNIFPPKTHRNTHEEGKRWETFLAFKNFALLCALFFGAGAEICESSLHIVTSLESHFISYVGKQHWTNNEPRNRKKIYMAMK